MNIEIKISNRLIPYKKAINILENRVKDIKNGDKSDFLWILEHPLTYTAGIRSSKNDVLDMEAKIYYQGCSEKGFCYPVQEVKI